ncbi:2-octaprenyl-6-methoxyphenyl hydroxylase [Terrihabitans soli]|uniref:2-octaprenyl-6-methoxyphenyl hydroxylase n=1 Tax=Terrihabitans soli TaxID=708113 RepID=A0A6S6QNG1_9HYPH|nr:FAD-dependent monooxygenase [Terrihabitans soli]BCJ89345.1 2-octaprenyl-6-methoxyphenyl hydroxylase [Terrihabitans soli]
MKHSTLKTPKKADVVIAGAGFVGLALGAALQRAGLDVAICDPALSKKPPDDPRASALVAGAKNLMEAIGAWDLAAPEAEAITRMEISDARLEEVTRPVMLTFAGAEDETSYVVPNTAIRAALFEAAKAAGVSLIPQAVASYEAGRARVVAKLADDSQISAALLVAAEGANSPLRKFAKVRMQGWRYDQIAIVTTVKLEHPHEGVAIQHFFEGGPFALLPMKDNHASVIWSERKIEAQRLYALPDAEFRTALQERAGWRFGEISLAAPRAMRPLELRVAKSFVSERLALVGDAAHVTHPLAGQGLNIGLRDVAALAESMADAARLGGDIGASDVLTRYESWRRFDTMTMLAATDSLLKLFTLPGAPARLLRDAGLGVVERIPAAKAAITKAAAGLSGDVPRLLRGEAL